MATQRNIQQVVLLTAMICFVGAACHASPNPKPSIVHWKPASVQGPALFVGTLLKSERFKNPPNADYATRAVYAGRTPSLGEISNACGLEQLTFSVGVPLSDGLPKLIILNRITGEWCDGVSARGKQFLIDVEKDGHWYATKVIKLSGSLLALPPIGGCLGNVDIKRALKEQGISLPPHSYNDFQSWRVLWANTVNRPVCWKQLPRDLAQRGISVEIIAKLWQKQKSANSLVIQR